MNERIKQLANQAGLGIQHNGIVMTKNVNAAEAFEQFAELIVKECIQVCKSRVGNSDYNTGRMHCVSDLKEHFGVEE